MKKLEQQLQSLDKVWHASETTQKKRAHINTVVEYWQHTPHQYHVQNHIKNILATYGEDLLIQTLQDMGISTRRKTKKSA